MNQVQCKWGMKMKKYLVISIMFALFFCLLGLNINWNEIDEYNEQYPNPSRMGACPPSPPYMYERMFMNLFGVLSFIFILMSITFKIFGDKKKGIIWINLKVFKWKIVQN